MTFEPAPTTTPTSFLLKDYELKLEYLTNHFSRMWTRFNYFVTIEAALVGGKVVFGGGTLSLPLVVVALILTTIWYVMGAQDRYLVQVYRKHVEMAAKPLAAAQWREPSPYITVGDVEAPEVTVPMGASAWRVSSMSTTRLAALIPLVVGSLWVLAAFALLTRQEG